MRRSASWPRLNWFALPFAASVAAALLFGCGPTKNSGDEDAPSSDEGGDEGEGEDEGGGDSGIDGATDSADAATAAAVHACAANDLDTCQALQAKIAKLQQRAAAAEEREDWAASSRFNLDANEQRELLSLYAKRGATGEALDAVAAKYKALRSRLEAHLVQGDTQVEQALVYHPLEVEALAKVREIFGDLYVDVTPDQADGTRGYEELSVPMPWAGYWYPMRDDALFASEDAPLVKLDRAVAAMGGHSNAAEIERDEHDSGLADTWEGLCGAWALAAVSTPEPTLPVEVGGVTFGVNDQKALLTKIHERAPSLYFGVRYNGDAATDGTLQDLRPEAFHRIFTEMLGKRQRAFLVDSDPSIEVWSKPVFRVRWQISKDPDVADAYRVVAFPWMVRHRENLDESPTSSADRASPQFEYRLYVDPATKQDGGFKVIAGEWLGASLDSHPDALMIATPGEENAKASLNAGINDAMDIVRQIVTLETP